MDVDGVLDMASQFVDGYVALQDAVGAFERHQDGGEGLIAPGGVK